MRKGQRTGPRFIVKGLSVLYEDKEILVVDKPTGLLTVANEWEKSRTAHSLLTDYIRIGCGRSRKRLYVVHRLDRDTSGVLIFAKSEEGMLRLKDAWKETDKKYLAVVRGKVGKETGIITSYLAEDEEYTVYSTTDPTKGKLAKTAYKVLRTTNRFSLLEVTLLTGRKNQVRVHLAGIGHPIVGDVKYGTEADAQQPRMALHARVISFTHPFSRKRLTFSSDVPDFFASLVGPISFSDQDKKESPQSDAKTEASRRTGKRSGTGPHDRRS